MVLDVLRGFALCGIAFPNAFSLWEMFANVREVNVAASALEFVFAQRFFPIFSLLFGISFSMLWLKAQERSDSPRGALMRRLVFLVVLGAGHQYLQPGEALLPYGLGGSVVLLPLTFVPERWMRSVSLGLGIVLVIASLLLGGGIAVVPGLFALGFAIGLSDFAQRLENDLRIAVLGLAVTLPLAAVSLYWHYVERQAYNAGIRAYSVEELSQSPAAQAQVSDLSTLQVAAAVAGVTMAAAYCFVLAVLMHTPARRALVCLLYTSDAADECCGV